MADGTPKRPSSSRARDVLSGVGFLAGILILGAVAMISSRAMDDDAVQAQWVEHTTDVLQRCYRMDSAVHDASVAGAAYAVGAAVDDLARRERAVTRADDEVDALFALVADNGAQGARLRTIAALLRSADADRFTHIDAVVQEFRAEELTLLKERSARASAATARARDNVALGGFVGSALVVVLSVTAALTARARRRVTRELRASREIIAAVVDGTEDSIIVKDLDHTITLANHAAARSIGRPQQQLVGTKLVDAVSADVSARADREDDAVARDKKAVTYESALVTDGVARTFLVSKFPGFDVDRRVVSVISIARDITEHKALLEKVERSNSERGSVIEQLEQRSAAITTLSEMAAFLQTTSTSAEAYDLIGHFAERLFPGSWGAVCATSSSRNLVEAVASWGRAGASTFHPDECWALKTGKTHKSDKSGSMSCRHVDPDAMPAWCVPMMAQAEALGILHVGGALEATLIEAFGEQLALALANIKLRETLRAQAVRDGLTGLFNRRYMDETLARELTRAQRKKGALSVIMIDLDHFKRLNDTFGHAAGDRVLQEVAAIMKRCVRGDDVVCRYGGEELAIVLPDLNPTLAAERAERIRAAVEQLDVRIADQRVAPITASFGVAAFPDHGDEPTSLLQKADGALYRAKTGGRNRVVVAA